MTTSDVLAVVALVVSTCTAALAVWFRRSASRQTNTLPVITTLFAEHRTHELSLARKLVYDLDLTDLSVEDGFACLGEERLAVQNLCWYYDNLGVYAAHRIVDVDLLAGYLGGSVVDVWHKLEPIVKAERRNRTNTVDENRYQEYFENLCRLVERSNPTAARNRHGRWILARD